MIPMSPTRDRAIDLSVMLNGCLYIMFLFRCLLAPTCMSVCLSVCLSVCMSVCACVCGPSTGLTGPPRVASLGLVCLSGCMSVCAVTRSSAQKCVSCPAV